MKLTKENICFIDNYLQNSEVIFADIRAEMTDHVASAVEEKMESENLGFYDAFKSYMAVNKREILKNNKQNWSLSLSVIKRFALFLLKPEMLVFGILHFVLLTLFLQKTGTGFFNQSPFMFGFILLSIALAQMVYFHAILKKRFYYIEKSGLILGILYYIDVFFLQSQSEPLGLYAIVIFSYFLLAYVMYFIVEARYFLKSSTVRLK